MKVSNIKINFELIGLINKVINCKEKNCKFFQSCANHETAGDFRMEDGFSPELFLYQDGIYCSTKAMQAMDNKYETLPINYDRLNRGVKYLNSNNIIL